MLLLQELVFKQLRTTHASGYVYSAFMQRAPILCKTILFKTIVEIRTGMYTFFSQQLRTSRASGYLFPFFFAMLGSCAAVGYIQ